METHTFTIRYNCPGKYIGKNRYLTTWEKKMKKAIDKQIDEEIQKIKEQPSEIEVNGHKRKLVAIAFYEEKYRREKSELYEETYRREYTLSILEKCGLNVARFKNTKLGSCGRIDMLLGCVQDKIDGFDYNEDGARIPNNKIMNVSMMTVEYKKGVLKISDGQYTNEFNVDKHELIYVNGENVFESDLNPVPTRKEMDDELEDLKRNLHEERIAHEKRMERSLEAAKDFLINY